MIFNIPARRNLLNCLNFVWPMAKLMEYTTENRDQLQFHFIKDNVLDIEKKWQGKDVRAWHMFW